MRHFNTFTLSCFLVLATVTPASAYATEFQKSSQCFQSLVKKNKALGHRLNYYEIDGAFLFPKSFLFDETDKGEGFYLVSEQKTKFCPFKFSRPTFGKTKALKSTFHLDIKNSDYEIIYNHNRRRFSGSKSLVSSLLNSKKPLNCITAKNPRHNPLKARIKWLVSEYKKGAEKHPEVSQRSIIAMSKSCQKIDTSIDRILNAFLIQRELPLLTMNTSF